MKGFEVRRLGVLMRPEPGNPFDVEGVLNPAVVRGPDGQLCIFPRLVSKGNFSRIGMGRVLFDSAGDPNGVERFGVALEPQEPYELRPGGGGVEDPRISYIEPYKHYTMSYVAFGPYGPRVAIAVSDDLYHWRRIGLATFDPYHNISFSGIDDKDSCLFPKAIPAPSGESSLALIHRPIFPGTSPEEKADQPEIQDLQRESIWMSYRTIDLATGAPYRRTHFTSHHRLAVPVEEWEMLKIGVGCPPVLCRHGWLLVYHGVRDVSPPGSERPHLLYSAGLMILAKDEPTKILYRSRHPILAPEVDEERLGAVANIVFPTGIDRRDDLGTPDRFDIYYGMADDKIGVARLDVPEELPAVG